MIPVSDFAAWRDTARALLASDVPPDSVTFDEGKQEPLFQNASRVPPAEKPTFTVPRPFLDLAEFVAMHRNSGRWDLLYRTLYRIVRLQERHLLEMEVDPDIRELTLMRKAVARDTHKMHAFVRFRKVEDGERGRYVAWHRPDHHIVEHVAPWFARRFGAMESGHSHAGSQRLLGPAQPSVRSGRSQIRRTSTRRPGGFMAVLL